MAVLDHNINQKKSNCNGNTNGTNGLILFGLARHRWFIRSSHPLEETWSQNINPFFGFLCLITKLTYFGSWKFPETPSWSPKPSYYQLSQSIPINGSPSNWKSPWAPLDPLDPGNARCWHLATKNAEPIKKGDVTDQFILIQDTKVIIE